MTVTEHLEELTWKAAPGWRPYRLSHPRRDRWKVSVSANCRLTFEERVGSIENLNLKDCHSFALVESRLA